MNTDESRTKQTERRKDGGEMMAITKHEERGSWEGLEKDTQKEYMKTKEEESRENDNANERRTRNEHMQNITERRKKEEA